VEALNRQRACDLLIAVGSLHILRHTSATLALTASPRVPLRVVAGRLGDDPKTVLGTTRTCRRTPMRWLLTLFAAALVDKAWTSAAVTASEC